MFLPTAGRLRALAASLRRPASDAAAFRELEARYQEIQVLQEISQTVMESVDLATLVPRILVQTIALGGFDTGLIRLTDPARGLIVPAASFGYRHPESLRELSLDPSTTDGLHTREALNGRRAVAIDDVSARPGLRTLKAEGVQSTVNVPVKAGEQVLGALQLGTRTRRHFPPAQVNLLEAIGSQIGLAVQKAQLYEERTRLAAILEATTDPVSIADANGHVQYLNSAARQMLGIRSSEPLPSLELADCCPEWAREVLSSRGIPTARAEGVWRGELAYRSCEGRETPISQVIIAHPDADGLPGYISTIGRDISDDKRTEEALKHQALHDGLTGLPNRTLLRDRIRQAIAEARRSRQLLSLLVMDLNRFKEVNDTFGHPSGDLLLQQVTLRMLNVVRERDTVARLGGDEFAMVLQGLATEEDAVAVAARVLASFEEPFIVEGHELEIGVSVGIALFPSHGEDADSLLRQADVAMYVAKREDRGYAVYSSEHDQNNPSRAALTRELRRALDQDELALYFQPKAAISNGRLMGVEALIRWPHPERGLLQPADFLSLAEQAGLMATLGRWVLQRALQECRDWQKQGLPLPVAVNLTTHNLRDLRLPAYVASLLQESELDASALQIEITESAIMADQPDVLDVLTQLRDMGVRIAVDDFGTGYSSLVYLRRLPVDEIKIDRSFVSGMADDENDAAIVRSTIDLGHNLGLEVVAEGVEDDQTWTLLDDLGCDIAQGYCISRPVPPKDLPAWARKWTKVSRKRFLKAPLTSQPAGGPHGNFWDVA